MDVYRAEKNVSHPTHGSSAEFKQGDALLSSSSVFYYKEVSCCSWLVAHSVALLLIALLSMTPEGSAEMLSGISKSRRAVICLMEKLCMP